jgi:hypothetical protein
MRRLALLVAPLLFATQALAVLPPLLADSAALDRAFIPALMLSNGKDLAKARAAHETYEKAWKAFAAAQADAKRAQVFAGIEAANGRARAALEGAKSAAAHGAQEDVRHALWQLRRELKLTYLPDLLTTYHETMEEIVLGTAKLEPARIGPADVARLKTLSATARREWKAIADTSWDPADYGFDAARVETFRAGIAAETKALDDLDAALASGEGERIAKAAAAVKPPYARTYATFGRFPG